MEKFYQILVKKLPYKLIYFCIIRAWAISTTGKYSGTVVSELTVSECIERFMSKYEN